MKHDVGDETADRLGDPVGNASWQRHVRHRQGPLLEPVSYRDTKDPCPVFDGTTWHLFGSAGSVVVEKWGLLHATAPSIAGPWTERPLVELVGVRSQWVAAPGVVAEDGGRLHMFVQTDFMGTGGTLEHLTCDGGGSTFVRRDTAVASSEQHGEAGIFDAHPAVIAGRRYLVYTAMKQDLTGLRWEPERFKDITRGPDIHLAESVSGTWDGPWRRLGPVLRQENVSYHCQQGDVNYEWGLEGPQLLELADGRVLMLAVCFVAGRPRGRRQRVFTAVADDVMGPYRMTGIPIEPTRASWESGEQGHGTFCPYDDRLWLFYQARGAVVGPDDEGEARWRYGAVAWDLRDLSGPDGPLGVGGVAD